MGSRQGNSEGSTLKSHHSKSFQHLLHQQELAWFKGSLQELGSDASKGSAYLERKSTVFGSSLPLPSEPCNPQQQDGSSERRVI
jgi:hypothetical protein